MKIRLSGVLILALSSTTLPSCLDEPGDSSWRRPPRYGHGGTDTSNREPKPPEPRGSHRFGYSGDDDGGSSSSASDTSGGQRDRSGQDDKPAVEKPSGPPSAGEMPFAKGVAGKPLSVKLPGYESLGEISIEQIDGGGKPTGKPLPPGTPVSIPDPNNPGKEIYFRVP